MTEEDRASSFDELARGLASGSLTRGKALKLMGAALVGGHWDHLASGRLLPTTSVSPSTRSVGRITSAVAATAPRAAPPGAAPALAKRMAALAPTTVNAVAGTAPAALALLRVHRMAASASLTTVSAVAATAPTAFVVQLVGWG